MRNEQNDPSQLVQKNTSDRFSAYLGKFAGITAEISSSDTPKAERSVVKLAVISTAGFSVLALSKTPWYGYLFMALPWMIFLILALKRDRDVNVKFEDRKKIRLNLELTASVRDQLDILQRQSDSASLTEVIRRSLALYNLVLDHFEKDGSIVLRNRDGTEEVLKIL